MINLLRQLSWPELRHHPWRHLAALLAVTLGVALALSVQLINNSALSEFSAAVRSVNGEPDLEVRAQQGGFDEQLFELAARHPSVELASPVVHIDTFALDAQGVRVPLKLLGIDALAAGPISPALVPRPGSQADRGALFDPGVVFLNATAQQRLGHPVTLRVQTHDGVIELPVRGSVGASGAALAVMDIAGAQAHFGWVGRLSRIDLRLISGADSAQVAASLGLPSGVRAAPPEAAEQQVSNVSRAYRVNLTVLALVALFTGAFLVFSILSLSVAKRQSQFALLGVLGLSGRERLMLVVVESALLGAAGSALGVALGTGLASLALTLLAGDLGGGFFPGVAPRLEFSPLAALLYAALGVGAAVVGGWLPARSAQQLAPAQALKGLGAQRHVSWPALGPVLLCGGVLLALLPPVGGIPLAAYLSVACLLMGGIACVPAGVALLLSAIRPPRHALALLAVERARHQRHTATVAVAGVVASLSLAVALTVMVASFRESVIGWLDTVLPADLYVRASPVSGNNDSVTLPGSLLSQTAARPEVLRVEPQRVAQLTLVADRPRVTLLARPMLAPDRDLPLVGILHPLPEGEVQAFVSEAMTSLYGARPGSRLMLPLPDGQQVQVFVRGVWRDYARQHGAVVLTMADYQRLTGDTRVNDLALWLRAGTDMGALQSALRDLATQAGLDGSLIEFAAPGDIRAVSLRIFDRSFAVTYWLQAVAVAIGLFGIAASFSAQVLSRRKEFGLLSHLGLTRGQVLAVVTAEGAVWTGAGALLGLLLGLAVSVVLVKVVNPQSFHWTMDLLLPGMKLAWLCAAVLAAGTVTAWLAARSAVSRDMALAVKEDW